MKILVFGATGYLGRHAVRRLAASGHAVAGFARNDKSAAAVAAMGADVVKGDLAWLDRIAGMDR